eukprot:scaffold20196_cov69-Phaeocystis_antarctica.AAC.3
MRKARVDAARAAGRRTSNGPDCGLRRRECGAAHLAVAAGNAVPAGWPCESAGCSTSACHRKRSVRQSPYEIPRLATRQESQRFRASRMDAAPVSA